MSVVRPLLEVFRVHNSAVLPRYATENSSCFDICACIETDLPAKQLYKNKLVDKRPLWGVDNRAIEIAPMERVLVSTGLIFNIPSGYSLRMHPRSGFSLFFGITLVNCEGVIDEDYVEPTGAILINFGNTSMALRSGERICQGELIKDTRCDIMESSTRPGKKTNRNGGFGSTGKE